MKRYACFLAAFLYASAVCAQDPATGFPPYGSFGNGGFDAVNLQNVNVNFSIPIVVSPGRGLDLRLALVYDSLLWKRDGGAWTPVTDQSGNPIWGWKNVSPTGMITFKFSGSTCQLPGGGFDIILNYSNYAYTDGAGTRHPFPISYSVNNCTGATTGTLTGTATDGSGYYMDATDILTVYSPGGVKITSDGTMTEMTDTNGNFISKVAVSSSETDWKDTAGRTALKIITSAGSISYQVLDVNGVYQTITVNLGTFSIKTNFGCSGVVEHTGTGSLPTSVVLPNGKSYSFTYEQTPGFPGYYTARVRQVTLPTGGAYLYEYPGANDSINCSNGTITNLKRTINDGTSSAVWQFVRSGSTTTVTAPQLPYDPAPNETVVTFDANGHETSRQIYQGSAASGTLLRTINTTWAANGTPASKTTILENNQQAKVETDLDTYGNLLALREYDWGSGAPGPLVRNTTFSYLSGSVYTALNIRNRVTQRKVKDGNGVVKSQTDIAYDGGGSFTGGNCITGAVQHDDANYGCSFTTRGDPTSITTYTVPVTPSGAITKTFTYDSLGNLRQADVNCCQQKQWNYSATTQFAYPDSVVSGPAGGPQLTTSATYNAYTGQLTTSTDENVKTTTLAYADPGHVNRLTSITQPDSAQITYSYDDTALTVTASTPIQGTSVQKQTTYSDGLGRPIKATVIDASGVTYSVVETQYDPLARPYRVSNPHNSTPQYWTETRFDALGRPVKVIPPDGSAVSNNTSYGYSGTSVTVTDPTGKQRKSEADGLGRLAKVYEPDVNSGNALTQLTTYSYTVLGALAGVSQGIQTRTFNYDGLGQLTSATTPEAGTVNYQYNNFGLVTQRTDARGVISTYGYDTLNRLTQVSSNVGSTGVPATRARCASATSCAASSGVRMPAWNSSTQNARNSAPGAAAAARRPAQPALASSATPASSAVPTIWGE